MKRLLCIALALGLGGCAVTSTPGPSVEPIVLAPPQLQHQLLKDTLPKSAMVCAPEPTGMRVQTERQAATYIEDVRAAGRDCRRRLSVLRSIILGQR